MIKKRRKQKEYPLLTKQTNDKLRLYKYIFEYLIDHSVQCTDRTCICYASTWNDALANMKKITDEYNDLIEEIFRRND